MKNILIITLLILSLISDKQITFPNRDGHTDDMKPLKNDVYSLNYKDRDKIGITRTYSPDNQKYFISDPLGKFTTIYLSEQGGELEKIYAYPFDDAGRSEDVIEIYWGGMSDKIYLFFPFNIKDKRVLEYSIANKEWRSIETSSLNGIIVAPIYYSNEFLIKDKNGYNSFNFENGKTRTLNILPESIYCDQKENEIIFCRKKMKLVKGVEFAIQKIDLYNIEKNNSTNLKLPTAANLPTQYDPVIKFVHGNVSEISYLDNLRAEELETEINLVLFDYKSSKYKSYPLGIQGYIDWTANGHAVYGLDYILYLKKLE